MARQTKDRGVGGTRRRSGALALAAVACALCTPAAAVQGVQEPGIEDARGAIERWVEVRRTISKERHDWEVGRQMLEERIAVVEAEIAGLRERVAQAQASIAEADTKRLALVEEDEALKAVSDALRQTLRSLEERTAALLARLPEPLRQRVRSVSQRLPEDPEKTKLGLGDRFLTVVGVLNEANKFNRDVTATSEVRTLQDGASAEVTTLYVGLGQAYYVSGNGAAAGVGVPAADGWSWRRADEAAQAIVAAIAILKNEAVAGFVPLPVTVQ